MEVVTVTICKWDTYNPKDFKAKYKHWFRLNRDLMFSDSLFGLDPEQKWIWICLLSMACQNGGATFDVRIKWLSHHSGTTPTKIKAAIEALSQSGALSIGSEMGVTPIAFPPTEQNNTIQNNTEHNSASARTVSIRSEVELIYETLYPLKKGKKKGVSKACVQILDPAKLEDFRRAVISYRDLIRREKTEPKFIKHFSTFVSEWEDYLDPLTGTHLGVPTKTAKQIYEDTYGRIDDVE